MKAYIILLATVVLGGAILGGCARPTAPAATVAATATNPPAAVLVATTVPLTATAGTAATDTQTTTAADPMVATDWLTTASVEGDYYILGNPAAPVRLNDYSDFL